MSNYEIQPYSFRRAEELGVQIVPSKNPKKKIDVYDYYGKFICSIGDRKYGDYFTYLAKYGKLYADERRRLYHIRHSKEAGKIGTAGWFALNILW